MFTAGMLSDTTHDANPPHDSPFHSPGPIDEEDMFLWEAIILGPKDTPYVSPANLTEQAFLPYPTPQEGGVFVAKLQFVSSVVLRGPRNDADRHVRFSLMITLCPRSR